MANQPTQPTQPTRRQMLRSTAAGLLAAPVARHALAAPVAAAGKAPSLPVALQRCENYEPKRLAERLDKAIDLIGGIGSLVRGKTVTVKLNLTGGPSRKLGGLPAHRTYHVHPNFVAALCHRLHRDGAKRIVLVESYYDRRPPETIMAAGGWDIAMIKSAGGHTVTFEDTRNRGVFPKYSRLPVPWGGFIFPSYELNQRYEKTDVYFTLAKLKDHANAGITVACKNSFGIAPTSLYGSDAPNEDTTQARGKIFHEGSRKVPVGVPGELDATTPRHWSFRVPRITADLVGVRPIDFCLIDGIETNRGGEGPWIKGVEPLAPKLLMAGRNPVCTDAVCGVVMGYNPRADHRTFPFPGDNHLNLLARVGVGTNDPNAIEVRGLSVADARFPFNPDRRVIGTPIF